MPIFGQVWLWSLLAFLLGALLCWLLVALPVRRRIDALENRLATIRAETNSSAVAERSRGGDGDTSYAAGAHGLGSPGIVPGFGEVDSQDEIRAESLTRAYTLPGALETAQGSYGQPPAEDPEDRGALRLSSGLESPAEPPAATRDAVTEYIGSLGMPLVTPRTPADDPVSGRDWFDAKPPGEAAVAPAPQPTPGRHLIDEEDVEDRGTIFTQRTMPIPVELIQQLDEAGKAEPVPAHAAVPRPEDSLVDDIDDDDYADDAVDQESGLAAHEPARVAETGEHEPVLASANGAAPLEDHLADTRWEEPVESLPPAPPDERIALVSRTGTDSALKHGMTVEPERAQSALPKRIPSKPQHRHPFGVQTVSSPVPTGNSERMRSLFEPVIPAEGGQNDVLPAPHRLRSTDSRSSAPGPFGPGSAMPLPGGASPSPEFTIKASVTALRYCTPESPQFGRTVAEVWFRSAADAERVGFRPVG